MSMTITSRLTRNRSARIRSAHVRWIVMHNDGSPSESATIAWVLNPVSQVSYHLYITRTGQVIRFVPDAECAWACGKPGLSAWQDVNGVNSWTLSVAFANRNDGTEPLTLAQIAAAKEVIAAWRQQYPQIEGVITHKMCATPKGRKHDPESAPNFRLADFAAA